ncbi:hypothetical protein JL722_4779 [Aureococcus anophagefferens]|nr:hypothetical protein JL722_4779 [Aureococcus anophagefferens]
MAREILVALALCGSAASLAASRRHARPTLRMGAEPLSQVTGMASMDQAVLGKYMGLDTGDDCQVEYVFLDKDQVARRRRRLEVMIVPRAKYPDPFRGGNHVLVLCDTYEPDGTPLPTNTRAPAVARFESGGAKEQVPWYGLEQEYTLFNLDGVTPLGWPVGGFPKPQGPYYCGAGADRAFGRAVSEAHYRACLYAGLEVSGTNAEVMPGQWEYQIGPSIGIDAADQLTISRYILSRFSYGVADRGCSIRIPRDTAADKKGYLEDRRPASNVDPYVATSLIFATCTSA